jgi:uncharacterized protein YprB with RNaseH-like and TPR domain
LLENTFCHIPNIGPKTEHQLWDAGILNWHAALDRAASPLSERKAAFLRQHVHEGLSPHEHWRLFHAFRHSVAYVDIETTGLGGPSDYITTIALYDGKSVYTYVRGENLDDFGRDIARYGLLVTFNGKCFDVPFIRSDLGLSMAHPHLDLRYLLASIGYRGGLKRCEKALGIDRGSLVDVDGYFAVLLWQDYDTCGNARALDTLLAYNVLDVVNLETLMIIAYNRKLQGTPFGDSHLLSAPVPPENPFQADMATIYRLRRAYGSYRW